jgi:hypothetical protein
MAGVAPADADGSAPWHCKGISLAVPRGCRPGPSREGPGLGRAPRMRGAADTTLLGWRQRHSSPTGDGQGGASGFDLPSFLCWTRLVPRYGPHKVTARRPRARTPERGVKDGLRHRAQ